MRHSFNILNSGICASKRGLGMPFKKNEVACISQETWLKHIYIVQNLYLLM